MDDQQIADALVGVINGVFRNWEGKRDYGFAEQVAVYLDAAEDYRLAFAPGSFRASVVRQQRRVRKLVFARLKLPDPAGVEK